MNPNLPPNLPPDDRAELEARVTALLLGETTAEEAAALRQKISQDPALAKLHDRLRLTLDLVRESAATSARELSEQPAPLKLSPAKREALLAHFKTVRPKQLARLRFRRIVQLAAAAAIVLLLFVLLLPKLRKTVVATGPKAAVGKMSQDVGALDTTNNRDVEIYLLTYADSKAIAQEVKDVFNTTTNAGAAGGKGPIASILGGSRAAAADDAHRTATRVNAVSDDENNAVLVNAPLAMIPAISNLIEKLDIPQEDNTIIKLFTLQNGDSTEMAKELHALFQDQPATAAANGVRGGRGATTTVTGGGTQAASSGMSERLAKQEAVNLVPDRRTQSLLVTASKDNMAQIEQIIAKMDSMPSAPISTQSNPSYPSYPSPAEKPASVPATSIYTGNSSANEAELALAAPPTPAEPGLKLNLRNVTVDQALAFLTEKAGFTINRETLTAAPSVSGTMDLVSDTPLRKEEIVALYNKILATHDLTAVQDGKTLTIMTIEDAQKNALTPVKIFTNADSIPLDAQVVTAVIPVHSLDPKKTVTDLYTLIPPGAVMNTSQGGDAILMTASQADVHRFAQIVAALETTGNAGGGLGGFGMAGYGGGYPDAGSSLSTLGRSTIIDSIPTTTGSPVIPDQTRSPSSLLANLPTITVSPMDGSISLGNQPDPNAQYNNRGMANNNGRGARNGAGGGGGAGGFGGRGGRGSSGSVADNMSKPASPSMSSTSSTAQNNALTPVTVATNYSTIPPDNQVVTEVIPVHTLNPKQVVTDLSSLAPGVVMNSSDAGNAIVVTGSQADVRKMSQEVTALDSTGNGDLQTFLLSYADSKAIAQELKDVFNTDSKGASVGGAGGVAAIFGGGGGSRGGGGGATDEARRTAGHVNAVSDDQNNAVVISAPKDFLPGISNLISKLDIPQEDTFQIKKFDLHNADSTDMASELLALFPDENANVAVNSARGGRGNTMQLAGGGGASSGMSDRQKKQGTVNAVADPRTQSILVTASKDTMSQIEQIVGKMDGMNSGPPQVYTYKPVNGDVVDLTGPLSDLFQQNGKSTSSSSTQNALTQRMTQGAQKMTTTASSTVNANSGGGGMGGAGGMGGGGLMMSGAGGGMPAAATPPPATSTPTAPLVTTAASPNLPAQGGAASAVASTLGGGGPGLASVRMDYGIPFTNGAGGGGAGGDSGIRITNGLVREFNSSIGVTAGTAPSYQGAPTVNNPSGIFPGPGPLASNPGQIPPSADGGQAAPGGVYSLNSVGYTTGTNGVFSVPQMTPELQKALIAQERDLAERRADSLGMASMEGEDAKMSDAPITMSRTGVDEGGRIKVDGKIANLDESVRQTFRPGIQTTATGTGDFYNSQVGKDMVLDDFNLDSVDVKLASDNEAKYKADVAKKADARASYGKEEELAERTRPMQPSPAAKVDGLEINANAKRQGDQLAYDYWSGVSGNDGKLTNGDVFGLVDEVSRGNSSQAAPASKVPILGDLPVLGSLASLKSLQNSADGNATARPTNGALGDTSFRFALDSIDRAAKEPAPNADYSESEGAVSLSLSRATNSFAGMVVTNGAQAYWPLNETAGRGTFASFASAAADYGAVALWPLNETNDPSAGKAVAYDVIGGFNGTDGVNARDGGTNSAYALPGVTADNGKPNTTNMSLVAWINPATNSAATTANQASGGFALSPIGGDTVYLGPARSFGGYISSLSMFSNSLSQSQIESLFEAGTTNGTLAAPSIPAKGWAMAADVVTPSNPVLYAEGNQVRKQTDVMLTNGWFTNASTLGTYTANDAAPSRFATITPKAKDGPAGAAPYRSAAQFTNGVFQFAEDDNSAPAKLLANIIGGSFAPYHGAPATNSTIFLGSPSDAIAAAAPPQTIQQVGGTYWSIAVNPNFAPDTNSPIRNPSSSAKATEDRQSALPAIASATAGIRNSDAPAPKPTPQSPVPQPEVQTRDNAFSTFSLNVSDVSFKLAAASLQKGLMPDPASVRTEEFINAFDFRGPEPAPGAAVGFDWERAGYPFAHNRDLLRFAVKTATEGRQAGRPLNLVLLLDKSGSMERADRVAIIREALRVLASQLKAQDVLSVVVFSRTARLWADGVPGSRAGALAAELEAITPEGGTNLEEAMKLAYEAALRHYLANGENRVVLLTDGAANLGDVEPGDLQKKVEANRAQGIALDCFGVGWEDYNDTLLEVLSRNGGGRYGFVNTPEEAATEFAGQLAGALRVAASDVKVQVEFNPARVISYRQIGYAKDQLKKEQFRDNTVKAAQMTVAESGNALYTVELNPAGDGPVCTVYVRYREPGTSDYHEHAWAVPYDGASPALDKASPAMRLAATASAFSEWLAGSPYAGEVRLDPLQAYLRGVPEFYGIDARPKLLETMLREARSISGK